MPLINYSKQEDQLLQTGREVYLHLWQERVAYFTIKQEEENYSPPEGSPARDCSSLTNEKPPHTLDS